MEIQQIINNQIKYLVVYLVNGAIDIYRVEQTDKPSGVFFCILCDQGVIINNGLRYSIECLSTIYYAKSISNIDLVINKTKQIVDIQSLIEELSNTKTKRKRNKHIIDFLSNQEI